MIGESFVRLRALQSVFERRNQMQVAVLVGVVARQDGQASGDPAVPSSLAGRSSVLAIRSSELSVRRAVDRHRESSLPLEVSV